MDTVWSFKDEFWFNVTFVYRGQDAQHVYLCGDFNGWNRESHEMQKCPEGFSLTLPLSEGFYQYKYVVDGRWTRDENNPHQSYEHGNSVMFVHMDPKVYGLRSQSPPYREYQRPHSDGSQFQVLCPHVSPEAASFGILQRQVYVYLPPSYQSNQSQHYPVVYAHDGQNLFSTPGNRGAPPTGGWYLDAKLDDWWLRGELPEFILVGIPNSDFVCIGNRYLEYCTAEYLDTSRDPFFKYVIGDIKGAIDAQFRTLPDAANTFTLGSSAGGLQSFVLAMNHSDIFSCGVCMSASFWYVDRSNHSAFDLAKVHASVWRKRAHCRLYIDSGDGDGDNAYDVKLMERVLLECGWRPDEDFVYCLDECKSRVEHGITHSEHVWRERVKQGLTFAFCRRS